MARATVHLRVAQMTALRLAGLRQGRPVAELVREAVDTWIGTQGVRDVAPGAWADRFGKLLRRRQLIADGVDFSQDAVESDVLDAVRESRAVAAPGGHSRTTIRPG